MAALLIIIIVVIIIMATQNTTEPFYALNTPNCGAYGRYLCSQNPMCGYTINSDGVGNCVPGNASGPLLTADSTYWEYGPQIFGDPYYRYPYRRHHYNRYIYP